jgi:RNA polymerase sigma-70 factor (ECF subfamily)
LLDAYRGYAMLLARIQISHQLRSRLSASDLAQDTLLAAHKAFAQFRGTTERELLSWLRRILASQLTRHLRHHMAELRDIRTQQQLEEAMNRSSQALSGAFASADSSPSRQAARREEAVILADALAALPAEYREVLVLRHLENLRFPDISQQMGRELENVKSLWRRALKKLREQITAC